MQSSILQETHDIFVFFHHMGASSSCAEMYRTAAATRSCDAPRATTIGACCIAGKTRSACAGLQSAWGAAVSTVVASFHVATLYGFDRQN